MNYVYVKERNVGNGEIQIDGFDETGRLVFGFRTFICVFKSWRQKARDYTPRSKIAVFDGFPAKLK